MKTTEERPESIDGASIERLVDGDLTESERRELLLRLESEPDGWRRCALAFLEDQAWRNALSTANSPPLPVPHFVASAPASAGSAWLRRSSIAATLMAATFAAGFAAGGLRKSEPPVEASKTTVPDPALIPPTVPPGEVHEIGTLQLVDHTAGEAPAPSFPILSGPGRDDRWLRSQPPSVPDYVRARWERQGYQVAERRKLVSVELEGGRRVSIPVDEVEVDYVGQKPL